MSSDAGDLKLCWPLNFLASVIFVPNLCVKLAREPAGQEYSEQTIQLTRAQKLERFGFLFYLYSDLPPRSIPLFKLESVAMGRPDRANARVHRMSALGH